MFQNFDPLMKILILDSRSTWRRTLNNAFAYSYFFHLNAPWNNFYRLVLPRANQICCGFFFGRYSTNYTFTGAISHAFPTPTNGRRRRRWRRWWWLLMIGAQLMYGFMFSRFNVYIFSSSYKEKQIPWKRWRLALFPECRARHWWWWWRRTMGQKQKFRDKIPGIEMYFESD